MVPRSWVKELRRTDIPCHLQSWPSLTDLAQSPISELQGMERAIIARSSLVVTKLSGNVTCRVVGAIMKSHQRNTVFLEATVSHAWDAPPLHHPLDVCSINTLHKLNKLFKAHLSMLGPMVMVMLWETLTRRNSKGLKQTGGEREREREREHEWKKKGKIK